MLVLDISNLICIEMLRRTAEWTTADLHKDGFRNIYIMQGLG